MNQKASSESMELSPLECLQCGEVVFGTRITRFHREGHEHEDEDEHEQGFPNSFVLERDFEKTIADMEVRIHNSDGGEAYVPDGSSSPTRTPINEWVMPDLYLGWGDAKYSHTKREILVNRLVAVLFTKLSYNYYKHAKNEDGLLEVHFNGTTRVGIQMNSIKPFMCVQDAQSRRVELLCASRNMMARGRTYRSYARSLLAIRDILTIDLYSLLLHMAVWTCI